MKKVLICLLALIMIIAMAGCGDSETPKEKGITAGYWVVEKIVLEGTEMAGDDLTSIFGPVESIMVLDFNEGGTFNGVLFEDFFEGTYTGTEEALELDFAGEKATGTCSDGTLEIKLADGSGFTLKNQEEMPSALAANPWVTYDPNFDAAETCAMSNFINYGWYYVEDDVLYGLTHSASLNGAFGAISFHMKGAFPEFDETVILDSEGAANNICKDGDYLYYLRNYAAVCRVKTDGSEAEVLYDGMCDYLQIHDGRLYFTDADYHFVSTDMDGGDLVTVVDKEIYYPYFISSDWIIFQDDADDESLHLYNTTHGTEVNITYMPSYNPIMDGHYLYFTDSDNYLCRVDMSDPETFYFEASDLQLLDSGYMIDEEFIYTSNNTSVAKEDWKNLTDTHDVVYELEVYVSDEYSIHHEFDDEGLISGKYLMSKTEGGGTAFL